MPLGLPRNTKTPNKLKSIESEYRPFNYWGWLENIEPEEVRRQVEEMWKAGLGGYVMHARGGLQIPYMGEQWQKSLKVMVEQGNELGMATVIDDEEGWPSGFGAGKVNGRGEEYWLKWLECERISPSELKTTACTLGVYILKENTTYRVKDICKSKDEEGELVHIYYKTSGFYVDNLDPKVVKEFITVSYEDYYSKFSDEFGKGIKGIFSDEPQIARGHITWSLILPEEFKKRFGYDLIDVLPAIYFEIDGFEQVRYHFWKLVSSLFAESYSKQIGGWCEKHNILLLGHTAEEDGLAIQMMSSGSAMPFYEYMQIPGIDWLNRIPVDNMTVKQVTSVAQQLGKERVLSEMFGCAGWNISFEELKWIGEWHYVLGINFMLQHLGLYSLRGSRKREYPAALFFQQPWWGEFKAFNDYFARLSKLMTESEPVIDLLVIHPMRSAWIAFNGINEDKANALDDKFKQLTNNLLNMNFDFHYGDEEIMLRYGKVEGNELSIGKFSYKAVIITSSLSLDGNTVEILTRFAERGGTIISAGEFPYLVEGKPDSRVDKLKNLTLHAGDSITRVENALEAVIDRKLRIANCDGSRNKDVYSCTRIYNGETLYFIVNTNLDKACEVFLNLSDSVSVCRLNILDNWECLGSMQGMGSIEGIGNEEGIEGMEGLNTMHGINMNSMQSLNAIGSLETMPNLEHIHLEPAESLLLVSRGYGECTEEKYTGGNTDNDLCCSGSLLGEVGNGKAIESTGEDADSLLKHNIILEGEWSLTEAGHNAITLDYCQYYMDNGAWEKETPVIFLQEKLVSLGKPADVGMKFTFTLDFKMKGILYLVIEEPDKFIIQVNGKQVNNSDEGWWIAKALRKLPIESYVVKGENEIVLKRHFYCSEKVYRIKNDKSIHEAESNRVTVETELESIYLLGDFAVKTEGGIANTSKRAVFAENTFRLAAPPKKVLLDNLVAQGYPFFAGNIKLSKKFDLKRIDKDKQKAELTFDRPDSIVTKVYINGMKVKTFLWAPYRADVTEFVREGENEIEVELTNSLRNLFGPHHHSAGELYGVGPYSYKDKSCWTDNYCFVRFGVSGVSLSIK